MGLVALTGNLILLQFEFRIDYDAEDGGKYANEADMDTDGFKQGATYNAIRDWIKAKYGYRATNLNIAQVKQKYGIIERENYNKPKSFGSKQPGCPEEKIKAIDNAMRHFQMI